MTTQDDLARQLIDLVREVTAPEAVLLQKRIDATLGYLGGVSTPNMITLEHIRRFLTGGYDKDLDWWASRLPELIADTDAARTCGCGGIGIHGVDHDD